MSTPERPVFFTVRKNSSFISWTPYGEFFNFEKVCIEVVSETEFWMWPGNCIETDKLGRKRLVYATKERKKLRNGIYQLVEEKDGRYRFKLTVLL